jgi:hypothetical protein
MLTRVPVYHEAAMNPVNMHKIMVNTKMLREREKPSTNFGFTCIFSCIVNNHPPVNLEQ